MRAYDTKNHQNKWSSWVYVPRLAAEYERFCIVSTIARIRRLASNKESGQIKVRDDKNNKVKDFPLFVYYHTKDKVLYPLESSTIQNKVKPMLQGVLADDVKYTPHTTRHAVASQLADMGVLPKAIAEHLLLEESTLTKTYVVKVDRKIGISKHCVQRAKSLIHKVLVPLVHKKTASKCVCGCASILA